MARLNLLRLTCTVLMVLGALALGTALLGTVVLGAAAPASKSAPGQQGTKELTTAGACYGAMWDSTLEWGISRHAQRAEKTGKTGSAAEAAAELRRLPRRKPGPRGG